MMDFGMLLGSFLASNVAAAAAVGVLVAAGPLAAAGEWAAAGGSTEVTNTAVAVM